MQPLTLPRAAGLRPARPVLQCRPTIAVQPGVQRTSRSRSSLAVRATFWPDGYMLSPTNWIMSVAVTFTLAAGRWGIAPTANRPTNKKCELQPLDVNRSGQFTSDPAGFTFIDCLALGAVGHILGVGIVLGLKLDGVIPWSGWS